MRNEKGLTLIEVILALGLLGVIGLAFLGGMSVASRTLAVGDRLATAESLARTEMEYIKNQDYDYDDDQSYEKTDEPVAGYPDYTISVDAEPLTTLDTGIQKITVTVSYDGEPIVTSANCTLEGYKGER